MFLKYWRKLRNLSVAELSFRSSVPIRTIEDIERRGSCKIDTAKKLAEALNINLYDLASDPDTFYSGKYAQLDLTDVLNFLFYTIPSDDFARLLEDIHTYEHGIHVQAMNKAYQLYEDIHNKGIDNVNTHWEKTLPRW